MKPLPPPYSSPVRWRGRASPPKNSERSPRTVSTESANMQTLSCA